MAETIGANATMHWPKSSGNAYSDWLVRLCTDNEGMDHQGELHNKWCKKSKKKLMFMFALQV